ncbi:MAG: hypothetical protein IBJ18_05865 [Phycisphaerales bacterium]|nr:hypothetical protein [Phycisphaerales bacterium]
MAFVLNGIGTWYWGKRNIVSRTKTCEFCGTHTTVRSYDTTLFFVVFFIPIFPLAKRRLIDACSSCRKHRYIPLEKYNAAKAADIAAADAALRSDPTNPQHAAQAIAVAVAYDDKERFIDLTRSFSHALASDQTFLSHLADAYIHFDMPEQNLASLQALTTLNPGPLNKRRVAMSLIKLNRPDDARPLIDELIADADERFMFSPVVLAMSYQEQGRHAEALALLDASGAKYPSLREHPEFKASRRLAEKNLHTNKPIRSADLHPGKRTAIDRPIIARVPTFIAAAVVLLIVGGYFVTAYFMGTSRNIWLVNATSDRYVVELDGRSVALFPLTPTRFNIAEGTHTLIRTGPDAKPESISFTIETPFFSRPWNRTEFVVNPDQLAVFVDEFAYYAPRSPQPSPPPKFLPPQLLHTPSGYDYFFEPFPAKISMSSNSGQIKKSRFDVLRDDPASRFHALESIASRTDAQQYLTRSLQIDPANDYVFTIAPLYLNPDDCMRLITPWLATRPVNINAHTAFQEATLRSTQKFDLSKRYSDLHKAEPNDPALAYLAGRVAQSVGEFERSCRIAIESPDAPLEAFVQLATIQHNRAEFADALTTLRKAARVRGLQSPEARQLLVQTLCAEGKLAEACESLRAFDPSPAVNSRAFWTLIALEFRARRPEIASDVFTAGTNTIADDAITMKSASRHFQFLREDLDGKLANPEEKTEDLTLSVQQYFAALERGQWSVAKECSERVMRDWTSAVFDHPLPSLSLSVAALARDDRAAYEQHLSDWLDHLLMLDVTHARFQSEFSRSADAALETLPSLPADPTTQSMALALIAREHPESYDRCLQRASRLNHTPGFYQHIIKQAFERLRPEPTQPRERKPAAAPNF